MRPFLAGFEGDVDDDALDEARDAAGRLVSSLKALGDERDDDAVIGIVEGFVRDLCELHAETPFVGPSEREEIRAWYEELALRLRLSLMDLDDLDGASLPE